MTDMPGNTPRPSGACPMPSSTRWCAGRYVMSWPSNTILPARTGCRPETVFMVVVLPAPLAPIRVTTLFSGTPKEMSRMASMRP